MSKSRAKGTFAETAVVKFLRAHGFPGAERRALAGSNDLGDIFTGPGLVWEVKNVRTYAIPAWLQETAVEKLNAGADYGVLVIKPNGVGVDHVGQWWAVLPLWQATSLLRDAGYGDPQ